MSVDPPGGAPLSLPARLTRVIDATGPISVAQFMGEANTAYYGTRDPLGAAGDFITAPEISQMFGELVGLCLADIWMRAGASPKAQYVELGPGRGTLARDALRAMEIARLAPAVHLVETSAVLRERQRALLPFAHFHDALDTLDTDAPLLIVANEFFDALPIRQIERTEQGWRERVVVARPGHEGEAFVPRAGDKALDAMVPDVLRDAPVGSIIETCPAGAAIGFELTSRLMRQGGCALIIDYGYVGPAIGDTLQAIRHHRKTDPYENAGMSDLTAHVDFGVLGNIARQAGLHVSGPVDQGAFLTRLGIDARTDILCRESRERTIEIQQARARLVAPEQMGTLFQVMAVTHPAWPMPEGFA